jgi:aspartokinase-like uncharacterized kinase
VIVVKVGGSLYDHRKLRPGLGEFLTPLLRAGPVILVPGGGPFADAVRAMDRVHALGDEASHWLALRTLSTAALFLKMIVPTADGLSILDPFDFARADDALPHSWDATSDSVAARVAFVERADRLILLKSIDVPPETPWDVAAERGWVDRHFPSIVAASGLTVEVLNFRRWLFFREDGLTSHEPPSPAAPPR